MDINNFSVFLTLAEEMNFTRAAERLYITQQALSGYIKRMEETYHVRLFVRKPTLKLTPEGEAMIIYARNFLENEARMKSKFAEMSDRAEAVLHIGMPRQRIRVFFNDIWDDYHPAHKNIRIQLDMNSTIAMTEEVRKGLKNLSMSQSVTPNSNLEARFLVHERNYCLVPRQMLQENFPLDWAARVDYYRREGLDPLDLKSFPFILSPNSMAARRSLDAYFHSKMIVPHVVFESGDQDVLLEIAQKGVGAAFVTPLTIYDYIEKHGELPSECYLFRLQKIPSHDWFMVYRNDIQQPKYVMDMVDTVEKVFSNYSERLKKYGLG